MEVLERCRDYHPERAEVEGGVDAFHTGVKQQLSAAKVSAFTLEIDFPALRHCGSFIGTRCPAGVADAWTLACNGLEWSRG